MAEEMKTRSIRADEQTLERFKALSEEFDNQGECLSSLIKAYEISKAKSVLTDTSRAIEDFETHTTAIQEIFITLLESINNADERIKNKYDLELQTRTRTISDLQMQNTTLNNQLDDAQNLLDLKQGIVSQLTEDKNKAESTITSLNSQLDDKQNIITSLKKENSDLQELREQNKKNLSVIESLKADLETANKTVTTLNLDLQEYKTAIEREKNNAAIERQKAELDKQIAISKVNTEHSEEIKIYQDKLEKLREEKEKLNDEIAKLKDMIRQLDQMPTAEPDEEDNPEQLKF